MMRPLRHLSLLGLFSLMSLAGVVVVGVVLGIVVNNAIADAAIASTSDELVQILRPRPGSFLDMPPDDFARLHKDPADYQHWQTEIEALAAGLPLYLIKVWNPDHTIVWSNRPERIGERYTDDADLNEALEGHVEAELSGLHKVENVPERRDEPILLEVYAPVVQPGTGRVLGVFEIYQQVDVLLAQIAKAQQTAWLTILACMVGLYLALVGIVARASQRLKRLQGLQELQRYFSPAIAQTIAANAPEGSSGGLPGVLGPRLLTRGEVTVLFTDIRGFTEQAEQLEPEAVVDLLNTYLEVVTTAVFHYHGSVDKFLGDGVLAVFGAPVPDADHARDAVRAVQMIQSRLAEVNALRAAAGQVPILIGTAITTGSVVTGNVGSAKQLAFTVIGDVVNLGARLVGMAQPGEVLLSARTVALLQPEAGGALPADLPPLVGPSTVAVRGRREPATIYVLPGPVVDATTQRTP